MRLTRTRLALLAGAALLGLLWGRAVRYVEVDRCLDRGSRWNDAMQYCEDGSDRVLVAWTTAQGHPANWVVAAVAAGLLLVVFGWQDFRRRSRHGV